MLHGLNNDFLYSALQINVIFSDKIGNQKSPLGTAFFVRNKEEKICLVTNRHMIDLTYKCEAQERKNLEKYSITQIILFGKRKNPQPGLAPIEEQIFLPVPDQKITFPADYNNDVASFNDLQVRRIEGMEAISDFFIPHKFLATENDIDTKLSVCDFVAFPGFPEYHDQKGKRPIFRTGTISSDPRTSYSYRDSVNGDCIAYEAFSIGGSSGSPVFAMQKGFTGMVRIRGSRGVMLIGINGGHINLCDEKGNIKLHSGMSYFYKSSVILEIIDRANGD